MTLPRCEQSVLRIHPRKPAQRYPLCRSYVGFGKACLGHKEGILEGFAKKYAVKTLVWYEQHETAESAITREKQIKKWNRAWKVELIEKNNRYWNDLYNEITG